MRQPWTTSLACIAAAIGLVGCQGALDQDRHPKVKPESPPASRPATTEPVATGDRDEVQPLPGMTPPPKPFVAIGSHRPPRPAAQPSALLLEHASPDAPLSLSAYGTQPVHAVCEFNLGAGLTGAAVQRQFGPPAGMAGIEERWLVYRLTMGRELWLNFADNDGPLLAADVIRGAENGYVRDRLYPVR